MLPLKSSSHRKVMHLIRRHEALSGAQLSRITGLRASTIGYILQQLNAQGLIEEKGYGKTTEKGGKRPHLWGITDNSGYLLGLEVMKNQIRGVIVSLSGRMILRVEKDFHRIDQENIIERVTQIISEMIQESSLEKSDILEAAVALPGIIDTEKNKVLYSSVLDLHQFDLSGPISAATGMNIHLINDANAGALGDQWYSDQPAEARGNILYVNYNHSATEIGLGIVIQNRLYTGTKGSAGEILSNIPSFEEWVEKGQNKHAAPSLPVSLIDLYYKHLDGDETAGRYIYHINDHIKKEISRIIGLLNPQRLVIGGEITSCKGWMEQLLVPSVKEYLNANTRFSLHIPEITHSRHGIFSVALGATAYMLSRQLETEFA